MNERRCPECGAAFAPRYGSQVCCGEKCKAERSKRLQAANEAATRKRPKAKPLTKAARRKAFFAARDAAFERAGLPIPGIVERDGMRVEYRGCGFGSIA